MCRLHAYARMPHVTTQPPTLDVCETGDPGMLPVESNPGMSKVETLKQATA